jgi:hypothetical protein
MKQLITLSDYFYKILTQNCAGVLRFSTKNSLTRTKSHLKRDLVCAGVLLCWNIYLFCGEVVPVAERAWMGSFTPKQSPQQHSTYYNASLYKTYLFGRPKLSIRYTKTCLSHIAYNRLCSTFALKC